MSALALATQGLSMAFGSLAVARDIELRLPVGARYALIGPNGAGKTTLINLMTGMLTPNAGKIMLGEEDITTLEPQDRVRRGLARTFQINMLFPGLNALEAVTLAVAERRRLAGQFWRTVGADSETIDEAYEILRKLRLGDSCYQVTRELPYGRQR
ncbi:MAG TPA: ATP-binding cassette domain-containing protein, partial [Pseudolabrys sp.]